MLHERVKIMKQRRRPRCYHLLWYNCHFISRTCLFSLHCSHQQLRNHQPPPIMSHPYHSTVQAITCNTQDYPHLLYLQGHPSRPFNEASASSYLHPRFRPCYLMTLATNGQIDSVTQISQSIQNLISPKVSTLQLASVFALTGISLAATTWNISRALANITALHLRSFASPRRSGPVLTRCGDATRNLVFRARLKTATRLNSPAAKALSQNPPRQWNYQL